MSPYSPPVIERAKQYYESKYGLEVVALEGFAATDSYMIGKLGPENARDAFARIDRPEIEVLWYPAATSRQCHMSRRGSASSASR